MPGRHSIVEILNPSRQQPRYILLNFQIGQNKQRFFCIKQRHRLCQNIRKHGDLKNPGLVGELHKGKAVAPL